MPTAHSITDWGVSLAALASAPDQLKEGTAYRRVMQATDTLQSILDASEASLTLEQRSESASIHQQVKDYCTEHGVVLARGSDGT